MPIQLCAICCFNVKTGRIPSSDSRPSYTDCARCKRPTCRGHGEPRPADRFFCIRCLAHGVA